MNSWELIFSVDFEGAPRFAWNRVVKAIPGFRPFLCPVGALAANVWCHECGCCHRVIPNHQLKKVKAVCQCDPSTCDDIELDFAEVGLASVDGRKLASALAAVIPVTPRVGSFGTTPAWRLGETILRGDGGTTSLIACFSGNGHAIRNAALAVAKDGGGPALFVCRTADPEGVEALLPPCSRVVGFDELWSWKDGELSPGRTARRLIACWHDELTGTGNASARGYFFERRGQKKIKVANRPFTLPLWRCHVNGRTFDLPGILGSELLVRILLNRGNAVYADGLMRSLTGEATEASKAENIEWLGDNEGEEQFGSTRFSPDERQEVLSTDEIAKWQAKMKRLKEEIAKCGDDPALAKERAELEEKREDVFTYLSQTTRPGANGKLLPRTFDDSLKKAGNLVGKHIRSFLSQLRGIDTEMHRHLLERDVLKCGQTCLYNAETGYPWQKI